LNIFILSGDTRCQSLKSSESTPNFPCFWHLKFLGGRPQNFGQYYEIRPSTDHSQTIWDPYTETGIKQLESVQRRAARFTLSRYCRTASARAMLNELNWEPLASQRRAARLVMFTNFIINSWKSTCLFKLKLHVRWLIIFRQHLLTTRRTFFPSYSARLELSARGHSLFVNA